MKKIVKNQKKHFENLKKYVIISITKTQLNLIHYDKSRGEANRWQTLLKKL